MMSWLAYGLTGFTAWLNSPKIPNAPMSADSASTIGTTAAATAPNVMSRITKVRPIVMNVVSRLLLMRFVMSSFVSVPLTLWTDEPASVRLDRGDRRPDGHEVAVHRRLIALDACPTSRTAVRSGATRPACGGAVAGSETLSKAGTAVPFSSTVSALSVCDVLRDVRLEGGIGDLERRVGDDDRDVLGRLVRAARLERRVGLRGLRLGLVRIAVRVLGLDPTAREADEEEPDRPDEPQGHDRPSMARTPHRDADGRGLSGPPIPASSCHRPLLLRLPAAPEVGSG